MPLENMDSLTQFILQVEQNMYSIEINMASDTILETLQIIHMRNGITLFHGWFLERVEFIKK